MPTTTLQSRSTSRSPSPERKHQLARKHAQEALACSLRVLEQTNQRLTTEIQQRTRADPHRSIHHIRTTTPLTSLGNRCYFATQLTPRVAIACPPRWAASRDPSRSRRLQADQQHAGRRGRRPSSDRDRGAIARIASVRSMPSLAWAATSSGSSPLLPDRTRRTSSRARIMRRPSAAPLHHRTATIVTLSRQRGHSARAADGANRILLIGHALPRPSTAPDRHGRAIRCFFEPGMNHARPGARSARARPSPGARRRRIRGAFISR